jgi:hypothetical protein
VSSRKVAERAFLAVFQRAEERHFAAQAKALASQQPLRALWRMSTDASNTEITAELIAAANHRKALRQEIARSSERSRKLEAALLERCLRGTDLDKAGLPPMFVSLVMTAISRLLAMDSVLGVSAGHAEAAACMEAFLAQVEPLD